MQAVYVMHEAGGERVSRSPAVLFSGPLYFEAAKRWRWVWATEV